MNARSNLSQEQLQITESKEPILTVRASAGAGKTRVLVETYLRYVLEEGLSPDQILTITFTKKAAGEMKRRIVNTLMFEGKIKEAQIAETGPVQTIHSFCEKTLRENALAAAVDPKFEILSEAKTKEYLEMALTSTLSQLHRCSQEAKDLVSSLTGRFEFNTPKTLHAKLSVVIQSVLHALRGTGLTPLQLKKIYESPKALLYNYQTLLAQELLGEPLTGDNLDLTLWQELLTKKLKERNRSIPRFLRTLHAQNEQEIAEQTCGLMELALQTWHNLEAEMDRSSAYDFTQLEAKTVRLIQSDPITQKRLNRQYQAVLVDEAQDINRVQYNLIEGIQACKVMFVGDPQQSIYNFRQADLELFIERTKNTPCKKLTQNYRSSAGILRFIDDLFFILWKEDYQAMAPFIDSSCSQEEPFGSLLPEKDFEGVELWIQKKRDTDLPALRIKKLIDEGCPPSDIAVLFRQTASAVALAEKLKQLDIPHRIFGGSEKFYTRLEIRDIACTLEAICNPYDDFTLLVILRSPMVGLSLDSIVALTTQKPIFESLRNFQAPILEDQKKLKNFLIWFLPLTKYGTRLSAWEVIAEIFHLSPFLQGLAERPNRHQALANVRKLLRLATESPELGPEEFARQIRNIQDLRHREGEASAINENTGVVTLMTIHKSKGLEFNTVILPDMYQKLNRPASEVVAYAKEGLIATKFHQFQSIFHKWFNEKKSTSEREEELRILYVAMTRAKEKLYLCVNPEGMTDTLAGLIARTLNVKDQSPSEIPIRENSKDSSSATSL